MLAAIQVFLFAVSAFFLLSILVGLFRPVLVLWFLDRFNRKKVLAVYGKGLLITILLLLIVTMFQVFSI